jgi:hypothetical protein
MSSPDQIKSTLASMLSKLPHEDVAHFVDAANRPENANMTPEQLVNMLVTDPRNAQLLAQVQQQLQSGGVNLGNGNTIGQMADAVAGNKIGGDAVAGNKIDASDSQGAIASVNGSVTQVFYNDPQALLKLMRALQATPSPPPPPAPEPRDVEIDRYLDKFSKAINALPSQGLKYNFPLTFQMIAGNGEPIQDPNGSPTIDQLITYAQNASSRKVILRGSAGAGKTTAMQRTAELIGKAGYDTILPVYIELRGLDTEALQRLSENVEPGASAESYLEPLLRAAKPLLNIDTLKCLGDYAEAKVERMLLVLVDGLNEVYGEEAARAILNRLDSYINARSSACVIISDRITPRDTATWEVARIERIPEAVIADLFKSKHREADYDQLSQTDISGKRSNDLTLLQTAYFLNYALERDTTRLSSAAEAIGAFFTELAGDLKFTEDALDRMAQAAFDAYKKYRGPKFDVDSFAQAIGQTNFDKLKYADVIVQLPADAAAAPSGPQAQFDHPLKHDYLVARYLSRPDTDWTPDALDVVSFESNSFDALAMTLELIPEPPRCDKFIQRVHNWNWVAALTCIAKAMRTDSGRHSKEIQLAVLALVAEKQLDPVQQTRKRASDVLSLFPQDIAAPYKAIHSLSELYTLVQQQVLSEAKLQDSEQWFPQWRDLFVRFDGPPFNEQDLKKIVNSKGIIGWTAANVFRRFRLSELDTRQLHAYYDACNACDYGDWRASTIRSRVVHALGGTDTPMAVELLFEVLGQDSYQWARISAARSLVEIAALTADADLRAKVIDTLISRVKNEKKENLALKTLHEIGQSAFYRDAHAGWQQAVTPLIICVYESQDELEKGWWSRLLEDFEKFCQESAPLAADAVGASPAPTPPSALS